MKKAFHNNNLVYINPHSFRHTISKLIKKHQNASNLIPAFHKNYGHSIDAQISKLHEYCKKNNLHIIKEYEVIDPTGGVAKFQPKGELPEFDKCLQFIREQLWNLTRKDVKL